MLEIFEDIGDLLFGNKRIEALKHFAFSKDFRFERRIKMETLPFDIESMDFFKGKKRKSIKGYLYRKELETNILGRIYDFMNLSEFGKKGTTIFQYSETAFDLPYFIIKPKSSFSKLGSIFSSSEWSDVNKEFASQFTVESSDLNDMRMMITIQFAELLVKLKDFTVEGYHDHLFIYKRGTVIDIVDMDNIYEYGIELADIILYDQSNEMV